MPRFSIPTMHTSLYNYLLLIAVITAIAVIMEFNEEHIEALARPLQAKRSSQAREEDARPMSEARQPL
ncbi:hypothetical protein E4U17_000602, partial [Claviceps sp. LM77 group G4]